MAIRNGAQVSDQTNPGGPDFRGSAADKRKDETVMVNADDLSNLVADARQVPPPAEPVYPQPAAPAMAAPGSSSATKVVVIALVLGVLAVIAVIALITFLS